MLGAIPMELAIREEATRLNLRPKRVDAAAIRFSPDILPGSEPTVDAVEELQQLSRGVDIAVARAE